MILDLNDKKAGDVDYKQLTFLSGETHIHITDAKIPDIAYYERTDIRLRYNQDNQLITLLQVNDALKRLFVFGRTLWLPYFPGGRQDRVCNPGESLAVKVYADLINSCGFDSVHVLDPHSEVTSALVNNIVVHDNFRLVRKVWDYLNPPQAMIMEPKNDLVLISPDAGSNKKIFKIAQNLNGATVVRADKKRDTLTGQLSGTEVYAETLVGKTCVIVDDICSRGGTFKGLAVELKKKGAEKIYLVVSHYENSANKPQLKESGIDHVYCTNSMQTIESDDFITQYNVFDVM
jgi:ribose-phosphate pyrophosphokinase